MLILLHCLTVMTAIIVESARRAVACRGARTAMLCMCVALLAGCEAEREQDVVGGPISAHGLTLGRDATPEQVAYVLLMAIRDDVLAVRNDPDVRETEGFKLQRRLAGPAAPPEVLKKRTEAVRRWAPTLAYYVDGFELDPIRAMESMYREGQPGGPKATVLYDMICPTDSGARATAKIDLIKENNYWRVLRIGYSPVTALAAKSTTQPTTRPAHPPRKP